MEKDAIIVEVSREATLIDQWHNDLIGHETLEWNAGPILGQLGALVTSASSQLASTSWWAARVAVHSRIFFGAVFNNSTSQMLSSALSAELGCNPSSHWTYTRLGLPRIHFHSSMNV
jgi:hypothetical protein